MESHFKIFINKINYLSKKTYNEHLLATEALHEYSKE